jgi:hypothetical protein
MVNRELALIASYVIIKTPMEDNPGRHKIFEYAEPEATIYPPLFHPAQL